MKLFFNAEAVPTSLIGTPMGRFITHAFAPNLMLDANNPAPFVDMLRIALEHAETRDPRMSLTEAEQTALVRQFDLAKFAVLLTAASERGERQQPHWSLFLDLVPRLLQTPAFRSAGRSALAGFVHLSFPQHVCPLLNQVMSLARSKPGSVGDGWARAFLMPGFSLADLDAAYTLKVLNAISAHLPMPNVSLADVLRLLEPLFSNVKLLMAEAEGSAGTAGVQDAAAAEPLEATLSSLPALPAGPLADDPYAPPKLVSLYPSAGSDPVAVVAAGPVQTHSVEELWGACVDVFSAFVGEANEGTSRASAGGAYSDARAASVEDDVRVFKILKLFLKMMFAGGSSASVDRIWDFYADEVSPVVNFGNPSAKVEVEQALSAVPWEKATFHLDVAALQQFSLHLLERDASASHIVGYIVSRLSWPDDVMRDTPGLASELLALIFDLQTQSSSDPALRPPTAMERMLIPGLARPGKNKKRAAVQAVKLFDWKHDASNFALLFDGSRLLRPIKVGTFRRDPSFTLRNQCLQLLDVARQCGSADAIMAAVREARSLLFFSVRGPDRGGSAAGMNRSLRRRYWHMAFDDAVAVLTGCILVAASIAHVRGGTEVHLKLELDIMSVVLGLLNPDIAPSPILTARPLEVANFESVTAPFEALKDLPAGEGLRQSADLAVSKSGRSKLRTPVDFATRVRAHVMFFLQSVHNAEAVAPILATVHSAMADARSMAVVADVLIRSMLQSTDGAASQASSILQVARAFEPPYGPQQFAAVCTGTEASLALMALLWREQLAPENHATIGAFRAMAAFGLQTIAAYAPPAWMEFNVLPLWMYALHLIKDTRLDVDAAEATDSDVKSPALARNSLQWHALAFQAFLKLNSRPALTTGDRLKRLARLGIGREAPVAVAIPRNRSKKALAEGSWGNARFLAARACSIYVANVLHRKALGSSTQFSSKAAVRAGGSGFYKFNDNDNDDVGDDGKARRRSRSRSSKSTAGTVEQQYSDLLELRRNEAFSPFSAFFDGCAPFIDPRVVEDDAGLLTAAATDAFAGFLASTLAPLAAPYLLGIRFSDHVDEGL